ncbi:MAG: helix-turn-helix transcriptional regulator [Phycisphaerales bacterium]|nr:helix-turn-helix transcriptional regulator [Phycisphaerales bacterium]
MANVEERDSGVVPSFSARAASQQELVLALLLDRISSLSRDSMADLVAIGSELARCQDRNTFEEIVETIREILFPDVIGSVRREGAGSLRQTPGLDKWSQGVGAKIRSLREAAPMTQEKLAELSDLPQSHISRLEGGHHSPSRRTLEKIASALNVDIGRLDPSDP